MKTISIKVADNAEAVFEAANDGLNLTEFVQKHADRWMEGAEKNLLAKEGEHGKAAILKSAITRRETEKAAEAKAVAAAAAKAKRDEKGTK